jgi:hypothetical protein
MAETRQQRRRQRPDQELRKGRAPAEPCSSRDWCADAGVQASRRRYGITYFRVRFQGSASALQGGDGASRRKGRTRPVETQPGLIEALEARIDPLARGDPESPLRWTTKSTQKSAATLRAQGFAISAGEKAAACK